jgi:hypothetical protein
MRPMHSSQTKSERVRKLTGEAASSVRRTGFFAVSEGTGSQRQLTFGVSIPWFAAAYRMAGAIVLGAIALIPSLMWAVRDRRVWPWDQAWYGELSVDLWYILSRAPRWWYSGMVEALGLKPPAVVWLGQFFVPLKGIFGSVEAALLFSILITQLVMLVLIYLICAELAPHSRGIGFIGILAAAGAEQFVGLSHQMFAEPIQCLAVAWSILIALRCKEWPRARTLLHLVGSSMLGLLAKSSTPLYTLIPTAFIVFSLVRSRQPWDFKAERERRASKVLAYGLIGVGPFAAIWYWRNYAAVLEHVRISSSGDVALDYGFRASVGTKFILWLRLVSRAFLEPYLLWIGGFLVLATGVVLIARVPLLRWRRPLMIAAFSAAQIALVLFVFSLNDAVETRYLYPLLPYITIVIAALCSAASYRAVLALVAAACLVQWATVNSAAFAPAPVIVNQTPYLASIVTDPTAYRELAEVVRITSSSGYNIVAVEDASLNANSAAFFAAKNRFNSGERSQYTSIGYGQKDAAAAMKRIEEFSARFVITLDEPAQPSANFLNVAALPVLQALKSSDRFTRVPFPSERGILIFERQNRSTSATRP